MIFKTREFVGWDLSPCDMVQLTFLTLPNSMCRDYPNRRSF